MNNRYILAFFGGFLACAVLFLLFFNGFSGFVTGFASYELEAPSDWVSEEDIILFDDHIVLRVVNATVSNYAFTGSMKPLFDGRANGIRVVPESEEEIGVGDIVSFRQGEKLVVHRVVDKGFDETGVYFITQGDNSFISDSKIRFSDIEYVTIGVIW